MKKTIHSRILNRKYYVIYCLICFIFWVKPFKYIDYRGVVIFQLYKGINKYWHTLDDCDYNKYDWNQMAVKEMVDFFSFMLKKKSCK